MTDEKAAAGFRAVYDWAMKQDFSPDHAERMHREAWDRSECAGWHASFEDRMDLLEALTADDD